jgi:hypothetical protein
MDIERILTDFRCELRNLAWQDEIVERLPVLTRRSLASGEQHQVIAFNLESTIANATIQEEIAHFQTLGKEFEWKVFSFDLPSDLVDRLRSAGFSVGDREAVVVYELAGGMMPFEGPSPCEVRRVDRIEQLADFRHVAEAVFNKDYTFTTNQLFEAIQEGHLGHQAYVAYLDDKPVSIGRLYTDPNSAFAGLY